MKKNIIATIVGSVMATNAFAFGMANFDLSDNDAVVQDLQNQVAELQLENSTLDSLLSNASYKANLYKGWWTAKKAEAIKYKAWWEARKAKMNAALEVSDEVNKDDIEVGNFDTKSKEVTIEQNNIDIEELIGGSDEDFDLSNYDEIYSITYLQEGDSFVRKGITYTKDDLDLLVYGKLKPEYLSPGDQGQVYTVSYFKNGHEGSHTNGASGHFTNSVNKYFVQNNYNKYMSTANFEAGAINIDVSGSTIFSISDEVVGSTTLNLKADIKSFISEVAEASYEVGYSDGYEDGYKAGYADGFADGVASVQSELEM